MKKYLSAVALCSVFFCANISAHSDHGAINGQTAINIAAKSAKQMTFKDFGFEVGKLDESWKHLAISQFSIISVEEGYYVVRAGEAGSEKQVFFKIDKSGQVLNATNENGY